MVERVDELECNGCKKKEEVSKMIFFAGKAECYRCWKLGIDKEKAEELREQLSQYIEIGLNKPKKNLTLEQLREVKQIFSDNYFGEFDERSKEIFDALVWTDEGEPRGVHPTKTVEWIEKKLEKKLKRASEPREPEICTLNCPFCNKEFSCELGSNSSWREAEDEVSEKRVKHIKEVHGEGESDSEDNQKIEPRTNSPSKSNLSNSTENKPPWPLIITGCLLVSSLLIVSIFLVSNRTKK